MRRGFTVRVIPTGDRLGARIEGVDLSRPVDGAEIALIRDAIGAHGVLCFPGQDLPPGRHKAFAARFGTLEVNVASGSFTVPGHPEVMILSNIVDGGRAIGLGDAGQGWHTDLSYSRTIAFLNILHGVEIPHRGGRPLGATEFADMAAAHDDLPAALKREIEDRTATHDFAKFWDMMRARPGSTRAPLTPEQRRQKPPVSHPIVPTHPISGRKILYCNPGYAVRVDGMPADDGARLLDDLFAHQLQPKYRYRHDWTTGDVLVCDNLRTLHRAIADYGPNERRLLRRCQVMADAVFGEAG
jgi:taurine dioxygenase